MAHFNQIIRSLLVFGLFWLGAATLAVADPLKIVGFGDSLMAGYQLPPDDAFPNKLQAALAQKGHQVQVANAGVSGDTTSGGLSRLDWSVPDGTDLVILELGGNDALRGISPDITRANLQAMIERLNERKIDVVLAGILAPPNMGDDYANAFNPIFPMLAAQYDMPLYPFFLDGVITDSSLMLADGIHPNSAGTTEMAARFADFLAPVLVSLKN